MIALTGFLIVLILSDAATADSDVRTVQSEFDRCSAQMERVDREMRRYEDVLTQLGQRTDAVKQREDIRKELVHLEGRREYLRNRMERASGQADKIRDDLKNLKGPTCPSCLASSVNLYCRTSEMLIAEIEETLGKARDLESRVREKTVSGQSPAREGFGKRFETLRADIEQARAGFQTCTDASGTALWNQALLNSAKADSLHAIDKNDEADRSLKVARTMLDKAIRKCPAGN